MRVGYGVMLLHIIVYLVFWNCFWSLVVRSFRTCLALAVVALRSSFQYSWSVDSPWFFYSKECLKNICKFSSISPNLLFVLWLIFWTFCVEDYTLISVTSSARCFQCMCSHFRVLSHRYAFVDVEDVILGWYFTGLELAITTFYKKFTVNFHVLKF